MPVWLSRPIAPPGRSAQVNAVLDELGLNTVCQSAKCPNRGECFGEGTATFLLMGSTCTRRCAFCAVESGQPAPLDSGEPNRVAEATKRMRLSHVVITCVTRDDLPDGGAEHIASTILAVKSRASGASVEVLVSDLAGRLDGVDVIIEAGPAVFNHNIETIRRLYPTVRPEADYERSLSVLERAWKRAPHIPVKSGLMLGLGESFAEVVEAMLDLRSAGCSIVTLGQYLRPGKGNLEIAEFVEPGTFEALEEEACKLGFSAVASAPYVRSSYRAGALAGER